MFLSSMIRRNPAMIETAVELHQKGLIPSNSYLIDIDMVHKNAKILSDEGAKYGLKVFAMTKQIGRNPVALKAIQKAGINACVTVDMNDARPVHATGLKVGHLGHLVQVPHHETKAGLAFEPDYWTVFSYEKAQVISDAIEDGREQKILARIYGKGDTFYKGHEGGFPAEDILEVRDRIDAMRGLKFAGITSFPTQLYSDETGTVEHTQNLETLKKAAAELRAAGMTHVEVNAPGTTSSMLFKQLAEAGVTQVEPGNSLAGTTPSNAFRDLVETPAMLYVSEVSHSYEGKSYCYGGGMYIDPVFGDYEVKALVGRTPEAAFNNKITCDIPDPSAIDYYGILQTDEGIEQGDTVIFGFRAQTFVTRAYMVPVSGISTGNPKVEGIFSVDGREVGWPSW